MNKNSLVMLVGLSCGAALCQAQEGPWRVRDALGFPAWLQLSFEHRARNETLDEQFRAGGSGGDQVVALRTLALMEAVFPEWRVGGEFIDSRVSLADAGTPVDTTQVNTAELLQAYAAWTPKHFLGSAASADIRFGRQTMDVGYRRLVARNSFRNTINAFTGLDAKFDAAGDWHARAFYVLPVTRRPDDVPSLLDEEAKFDYQDFNTQFWGLFFRKHQLGWGAMGEVYVFGLHEEDGTRLATRDRELYTPGFRVYRDPAKAEFDFELESIYQFGESRASTAATDVVDLDHFAHMQHAQAGYTFDAPWSPRVLVQYDYASGDEDPFDGDNERFDTLFGARRFEFGPTGIWGAFARSNINSPGYRLIVKPYETVSAFIGHRMFWLASDQDTWTTSGIRDATGTTDDFIGHQIEASVTWQVIPKNIILEGGWARLIKGEFAEDAPNAPETGDSNYFYTQTVLQF